MEYFDSETFIKQKEIVPFTISALSPPAKFAFKCPTQTEFFTEVCCVINGCCRIWQSHLLVLLFLLLVFFSSSASFHEAKMFFLSHRSRKRTLHLRKKIIRWCSTGKTRHFLWFHSNVYLPYVFLFCDLNFNSLNLR